MVDVQAAYITGRDGATFPQGSSYRDTMKNLAERLASQIAMVTGAFGGNTMQSPSPITLHGYLIVYPEDLGVFSSEPANIIMTLNNNNSYEHNNWRLPTDEELALMFGAKDKLFLNGTEYMTMENCDSGYSKYVRLVTLSGNSSYSNLIVTVNGTRYQVLPYDVEDTYALEECNRQKVGGYDDWEEPSMAVLWVWYEKRKIIGGFKDRKYESRDYDYYEDRGLGIDFSDGRKVYIRTCCKPTRLVRRIN